MAKKDKPTDPFVIIEVGGVEFSFPRNQDDWPTRAIIASARVSSGNAQYYDVVECLLGPDQWGKLNAMPFRVFKEFLGLFSAAMDEMNGA